jgi:hypothetical protein
MPRMARAPSRVLTREDDDKANDDGEDGEGDDLAVHAPIITHSPAYARGTPRKPSERIAW